MYHNKFLLYAYYNNFIVFLIYIFNTVKCIMITKLFTLQRKKKYAKIYPVYNTNKYDKKRIYK